MNEDNIESLAIEPERYELQAEIGVEWEAAKREFFEFAGSGLVVVYAINQPSAMHESSGRRGGPGHSQPQEIGVWLHISETGNVTGYAGKVEVGQNIRTSFAQVIAEELPFPMETIQLVLGDTDVSPFDFGTVGSRSTPVTIPQFRRAAAVARETLLDLAAAQHHTSRKALFIEAGQVVDATTGREFNLANLLQGQHFFRVANEETETLPPAQWQGGTSAIPRANGRDLITGKHHYTSDTKRPEMMYGKVLRPPATGAKRISLDASALETMPEVQLVQTENFVGVVAPDDFTATRALALLNVEWELSPASSSTHEVFDYFKTHPVEARGFGGSAAHIEGDIKQGFAEAEHVLKASYTIAYIAHAPLEPRAAVAEWDGEGNDARLTVWTGTQRPFGVRTELAETFGISEDRIRVIVPDTGSGYGGKHTGDAAIEAAKLAKAVCKPVKLVWTREEEFTSAYFRPAGVIDIRSGTTATGEITAWEHHNTNSGSSAMRTLYRVPNQHIEFHPAQSPLRQGSYRALAATANHFARETHMDELAHRIGAEPLEFRLRNLGDERLLAVLQAAAQQFGWGTTRAEPHHGFGIAGGHEKGSYVASCAEVFVNPADGKVKVVRVVTAFECGAIISPDTVKNQVEGAVIQGLGGALFEQVEFENGTILNPCFSQYRLPRFSDIPRLETVLLDRQDLPSVGAGETPIVAIAPAIGNAIFAATGVRLRSMPLAPHGVTRTALNQEAPDL